VGDGTWGKNLLQVAIQQLDYDGIQELLPKRICCCPRVDAEGYDALSMYLCYAVEVNNITKLALIDKMLATGAKVTEQRRLEVNSVYTKGADMSMVRLTSYRDQQGSDKKSDSGYMQVTEAETASFTRGRFWFSGPKAIDAAFESIGRLTFQSDCASTLIVYMTL
jgi:hypothetical protein